MNKTYLAVAGLAVVVGGVLLFDSVFTVHEREQALVLEFGKTKAVVPEAGLHFPPARSARHPGAVHRVPREGTPVTFPGRSGRRKT